MPDTPPAHGFRGIEAVKAREPADLIDRARDGTEFLRKIDFDADSEPAPDGVCPPP